MSDLYEEDFYSWALTQADLLRARSGNRIDRDHLAEELRCLGASEERELYSRYEVLLRHLLNWAVQPDRRARSWENTIKVQRSSLARRLARNPGLKRIEARAFVQAYATAAKDPAWWPA